MNTNLLNKNPQSAGNAAGVTSAAQTTGNECGDLGFIFDNKNVHRYQTNAEAIASAGFGLERHLTLRECNDRGRDTRAGVFQAFQL